MNRENNLSEFYREQVEPLLFTRINELFPEFKLNRQGNKWESPYKLDGHTLSSSGRSEKTIISDPQGKSYTHIRALEQGGESKDILELFMEREGLGFRAAVEALAKLVNVDVPKGANFDEELYNAHKKKQERLQALLSEMKEALFTPEASAELQYLTGTDYTKEEPERGYTEQYIKELPVGFISPSMEKCYKELCSLLSYKDSTGKAHNVWSDKDTQLGVGYTHRIAIAYIAEGDIKGFSFRTLLSKRELKEIKDRYKLKDFPKYLSHYTGEKNTQKYFPIATPSGRLSAYKDIYLNFTLVEGLLDTYRGLSAGVLNVVGISQGGLTNEQLQKLKEKQPKRITIMKDTEALLTETGESNEGSIETNLKEVEKAVNRIHSAGLSAYVLYLPSAEDPHKKVDLDEYFKGLEGEALQAKGAELTRMINDEAEGGFVFLYKNLEKKYLHTDEEKPQPSAKDIAVLSEQTKTLCKHMQTDEHRLQCSTIEDLFYKATGSRITLSDIAATPIEPEELEPEEEELQALKKKYRDIESSEDREKRRAGKKKGIFTNFTFFAKKGSESEQFMLPSGALSYVCFPTSHGKTRLLENLALQLTLNEEEEGSVLFFSVEEDADAIEDEFLNIYYTLKRIKNPKEIVAQGDFQRECKETHLSENNLRTIRSYYAEADKAKRSAYFKGGLNSQEHKALFNNFEYYKNEFYENLIETEKLKVFYEESRNVDEIIKGIKFLSADLKREGKEHPIKAVFIDYIQRLRKTGDFRGNRKEELTAVTNELMNLSVKLQVPFIIAVQLNRDALSPLDMDVQNIADASEIELSGNVVMLGWSSSFDARSKTNSYYYKENKKKTETDEAKDFKRRTGITIGEEGNLYVVLAKNRSGLRDIEARLYFDGNSGLIIQGERLREEDNKRKKAQGSQPTAQSAPQQTKEERTEAEKKASEGILSSLRKKPQPIEQPQPQADDPDPLPRNEDESDETPF